MNKDEEKMTKYYGYVITHLDKRDMLELLAEESCELAKAALKMIRAFEMNENVTPLTKEQATKDYIEEITDVFMVLLALDPQLTYLVNNAVVSDKWKR